MKKYRVYDIDWDITEDDLLEIIHDSSCSISTIIHDLAESLPKETIVEIDEDDETDTDELIVETLSDDYGWCVCSFKFGEVKGE